MIQLVSRAPSTAAGHCARELPWGARRHGARATHSVNKNLAVVRRRVKHDTMPPLHHCCHIHQHTSHPPHSVSRLQLAAFIPAPVCGVLYVGRHTRSAVHLSSASAAHSAMSTLEAHCQRFPECYIYLITPECYIYLITLYTLHLCISGCKAR